MICLSSANDNTVFMQQISKFTEKWHKSVHEQRYDFFAFYKVYALTLALKGVVPSAELVEQRNMLFKKYYYDALVAALNAGVVLKDRSEECKQEYRSVILQHTAFLSTPVLYQLLNCVEKDSEIVYALFTEKSAEFANIDKTAILPKGTISILEYD